MDLRATFFALADSFLPPEITDPEIKRRQRAAILQSWLGTVFTLTFGGLYAFLGSPLSGLGISFITVGLFLAPPLLRRGVSLHWVTHIVTGTTWLATWLVCTRSGGFHSPALVWNFLLPLCIYAISGKGAALIWSLLSCAQFAYFYATDWAGVEFYQDFGEQTLSLLRLSGYIGVVAATVAVLSVVESARVAASQAHDLAQRRLDRQRILEDMHDGVGSQLLGLLVRAKKGKLPLGTLSADLESCFNDLRLIVDSLDPADLSLELAFGGARARIDAKSEALNIETVWRVELGVLTRLAPKDTLQILRALQEMAANAQRHAQTERLEIRFGPSPDPNWQFHVSVRDFGVGMPKDGLVGGGRGLKSLRTRARKLQGTLEISACAPGTEVTIHFVRERNG